MIKSLLSASALALFAGAASPCPAPPLSIMRQTKSPAEIAARRFGNLSWSARVFIPALPI